MNQIEQNVLTKVTNVLHNLGLKYAIVDSDGNKHGDLEVVTKKKRVRSVHPVGELRDHVLPYMKNLLVNTSVMVPHGKFAVERVRSSISSHGTKMWGAGNYTTQVTADKKFVKVTRFDKAVKDFLQSDPLEGAIDDLFADAPQPLQREGTQRMPRFFRALK